MLRIMQRVAFQKNTPLNKRTSDEVLSTAPQNVF